MTAPLSLSQDAKVRLRRIQEQLAGMDRLAEGCRAMVIGDLQRDVYGLKAHVVAAEYSELLASSARTIAVQADAITKLMKDLKWPPIQEIPPT